MTRVNWQTTLVTIACLMGCVRADPNSVTPLFHHNDMPQLSDQRVSLSSIASIFSPRMDFDQWKPLTGRGDPLRNDPTYDYEPPMLEKVHYWADDTRLERDRFPEKKSEVLMLGVSSRKPSVSSRPPVPPKRHNLSPPPQYQDFSYKNEYYPMTILVPPPPPPAGYKPSLFIPTENKLPNPTPPTSFVEATRYTIATPEVVTSFALQEANLIYEATDNNHTWFIDLNKTQTVPSNTVSSDYAGWGPTTPFNDENTRNEFINVIPHREHQEKSTFHHTFPPKIILATEPTATKKPTVTFLPTALPPVETSTSEVSQETWPFYEPDSSAETTTENNVVDTTEIETTTIHAKQSGLDMLNGMMSMPVSTNPDRPEDNLYAYASENIQIFKDISKNQHELEVMQTMQPPPPATFLSSTTPKQQQSFHVNPHLLNTLLHERRPSQTQDPYLHMRYTTPLAPTVDEMHDNKPTTDTTPMYLIIQGHSKVKTYGSQPAPASNAILDSDRPKQHETSEVKHLHPIKDKYSKKNDNKKDNMRSSRSQNLTSLIDSGIGSIEIQEADLGIKYDVSDGSDVPVEIYKKGIVENDDSNRYPTKTRAIRQVDLSDLIPIDEDTLEEIVYNFFETRKNSTGITGFIAKAITGNVGTAVKEALIEDKEDRHQDR